MGKLIDLTGQRFGRWTVLTRAQNKSGRTCWCCKCDCGTISFVLACHLQSGRTKSCGCLHRERSSEIMSALRTAQGADGRKTRRLYVTWHQMKHRCNNPNDKSFPNYGGRGIKVCDEWMSDYWTFEKWALNNGWREGLSLDRIDNNGPYAPWNCRWATITEQNNNQRSNIVIEFQGKKQTLSQWAEELGINFSTLKRRYHSGWSTERILTTPIRKTK